MHVVTVSTLLSIFVVDFDVGWLLFILNGTVRYKLLDFLPFALQLCNQILHLAGRVQ